MAGGQQGGEKPRRQWAPDARALSVVGDRWVMVIVRDLASGPLRLEALRRWLPGVSAGALE
ncbi:MAG TPA: winged helix-turn-helix transcriptional regulator, partial [Conexibacter sp.]